MTLNDLRVPSGNRLKSFKGDLQGCYSMRVNDRWQAVFCWDSGNVFNEQIADYRH